MTPDPLSNGLWTGQNQIKCLVIIANELVIGKKGEHASSGDDVYNIGQYDSL